MKKFVFMLIACSLAFAPLACSNKNDAEPEDSANEMIDEETEADEELDVEKIPTLIENPSASVNEDEQLSLPEDFPEKVFPLPSDALLYSVLDLSGLDPAVSGSIVSYETAMSLGDLKTMYEENLKEFGEFSQREEPYDDSGNLAWIGDCHQSGRYYTVTIYDTPPMGCVVDLYYANQPDLG